MTENLRLGGGYKTFPVTTVLDFSGDGGFAGAVEMCSGVGACRKKTGRHDVPLYRATMMRSTPRGAAPICCGRCSGGLRGSQRDLADPRPPRGARPLPGV